MLDYIVSQTEKYLLSMPKDDRKSFGQFFTSKTTAQFMAGMFSIPNEKQISVLDPGAGSGILSAAIVEEINKRGQNIDEIHLTCYENCDDIIPLLSENLDYLSKTSRIKLISKLITDDYLLSQSEDFCHKFTSSGENIKYNIVIGNPPYYKIGKSSKEAKSMPEVCYGAPNIYFLFASMSLFNLSDGGELVYIIPRSWTSGAYFSRFRNYFLTHGKLKNVHIFTSRKDLFDSDSVLQETIIIRVRKTEQTPESIIITSSTDSKDFSNVTEVRVPYKTVVSGKERYVYLVTNQDDVKVLQQVNKFDKPMPQIGLKMKTGLTVDFRNRELLRNNNEENTVPLFYSQHLQDGRVIFPIGKENEYIVDELPGMIQHNRNYLFVKRFTSKEERRRLQSAVYIARNYPEYSMISTQNKINFIDTVDDSEMSEELVCGLYAVLNSTLYDKYYRILNGSTQVNATEMNAIPFPARNELENMGHQLISTGDFSTGHCDRVLSEVLYA